MRTPPSQDASIVWYGERGIINALVVALQAQGTLGWRDLLRAVRWAHGAAHAWLNDIERVVVLVEVGLADFGDPDLILVLESKDRRRRVVFVEAKVVSYASSAMSNLDGMGQKSFNSTINGQLALRYRFAHALAEWREGARLSEPASLHQAYVQELDDPAQHPRHLQKPSVRRILQDHGLLGLPLQDCYFVALTSDAEPFFEIEPEDTWPRLLDVTGKLVWHDRLSQIGWLGYTQLERAVELGAGYRQALSTMVSPTVPAVCNAGGPRVKTKPLSSFSEPIHALVRELAEHARTAGFDDVAVLAGSVSVRLAGRVRLKLLPANVDDAEVVRLGIAEVEQPQTWCEQPLQREMINSQPFYFATLPQERASAIDVAEGILEQLRARHGETSA